LEVDSANLKRWDFVRVKIGCNDVTKVPAVVEGLMDFHFYDFTFQREVPVEGTTNSTGTQWTRKVDRADDDDPSSKKPKWGHDGTEHAAAEGQNDFGIGTSDSYHGKHHKTQTTVDEN